MHGVRDSLQENYRFNVSFSNQTGQLQRCPMDPYVLLPDKCRCVDFQQLKLQELPEDVPHSEMPRHMLIYADR
jgi:DNA replication licensing factor MCM5